jgi:lipid II:glycine glycyltransferase (peptidoglycan interpeptide bridge formation enzyme)
MKDIYIENPVDITKLTNEELKKLCAEIQKVLNDRKETKRKEAWHKLAVALEEYLTEYGDIEYSYDGEEIYISAGNHYNQVGVINGWD